MTGTDWIWERGGEKIRHPLALADLVGEQLVAALGPACRRIMVAGSVRRRRPDVGDIEILLVPKIITEKDMFGQVVASHSEPNRVLMEMGFERGILRPNGAWGPYNKRLFHIPSGIPVDVFTASMENWGRDLLVRTGPADFNIKVMSRFRQLGCRGHAYGDAAVTLKDGSSRFAPDEETMFGLLGWDYLEPEARK